MADLDPKNGEKNQLQSEQNDGQIYGVDNFGTEHREVAGADNLITDYRKEAAEDNFGTDYREETAAEIAAPMGLNQRTEERNEVRAESGTGIGLAAIALSILSLFVFPVLFGAAGIVLGFIARAKGARTGTWAITIGAISLILGMFILPFF